MKILTICLSYLLYLPLTKDVCSLNGLGYIYVRHSSWSRLPHGFTDEKSLAYCVRMCSKQLTGGERTLQAWTFISIQ